MRRPGVQGALKVATVYLCTSILSVFSSGCLRIGFGFQSEDLLPLTSDSNDGATSAGDPGAADDAGDAYGPSPAGPWFGFGGSEPGPIATRTTRSSTNSFSVSTTATPSTVPLCAFVGNQPAVAWTEDLDNPKLYLKRFNGSAWEQLGGSASNEGISVGHYSSVRPTLAAGAAGPIMLAWHDYDSSEVFAAEWNGSAWTGWADSMTSGMSNTASDSETPSLAVDPAGNPVIAWQEHVGGGRQIYLLQWDGLTWGELSGSATGDGLSGSSCVAANPTLAFTQDGQPIVAWEDCSSGKFEIYVKQLGAGGWLPVGPGGASGGGASATAGDSYSARLAVGASVFITWIAVVSGVDAVYVAELSSGSWVGLGGSSSGYGVSGSAGNAAAPQIVVDSTGAPVVAFAQSINGRWRIFVRRWSGSAWVELAGSATGGGVSASSGNAQAPCLAIGTGDRLLVAWQDDSPGQNDIFARVWNGSAWTEVGASDSVTGGLGNNLWAAQHPRLVLDDQRRPLVAWQQQNDGHDDIYLRRWSGTQWIDLGGSASGGGVSQSAVSAVSPDLALDAAGRPVIAWSTVDGGASRIFVKRWQDPAWSELAGSASLGGVSGAVDAVAPALALDAAGQPLVGWQVTLDASGDGIQLRGFWGGSWTAFGASGSGAGLNPSGTSHAGHVAVIVDGTGRPLVAWSDAHTGTARVYVLRWEAGAWQELGGSGSGDGVDPSSTQATSPALARDQLGNPVAAWLGGDAVYLRRFSDAAARWDELGGSATGAGLSAPNGTASEPAITADELGNVFVAWTYAESGKRDIYLKQWDGSGWLELSGSASGGGVSNSDCGPEQPAVAAGGGRVCVAWTEMAEEALGVFVRCHD